jgi:hypothetical protein
VGAILTAVYGKRLSHALKGNVNVLIPARTLRVLYPDVGMRDRGVSDDGVVHDVKNDPCDVYTALF